jgi:hypothetical protein
VTVTEPDLAMFSVVATGDGPLTYQWRRNSADLPGEVSATLTLPSTSTADNGAVFDVVVTNSVDSVTSAPAILTVLPSGGGTPVVAWTAADQNSGGSWANSGWADRSFRILLDGAFITTSGSTVQLTLRGRSSGSYTVQRMSLVQRDESTLNGVDSTNQLVTFGGSWDSGVTVPAGGTVTSDPIPFNVVAAQDVFLTYWVPAGNPTVYRNGGGSTSAWAITGNDQSATIDWGSLGITSTRSHVYVVELMEVVN